MSKSCFTGTPLGRIDLVDRMNGIDRDNPQPVKVNIDGTPFKIDDKAVHEKRLDLNINLNLSIQSDVDLDRLGILLNKVSEFI